MPLNDQLLSQWKNLKAMIINQQQELKQVKAELAQEKGWWDKWQATFNPHLAKQLSEKFPYHSLISLGVRFKNFHLSYQGDFNQMKQVLQIIKDHCKEKTDTES